MLNLSLAGLIGAIMGTAVAALVYGPLAGFLARSLAARTAARGGEESKIFKEELPFLLRGVLAADIIVFAGIGYWLGVTIAG
jgi:hypothetical protein